MSRHYVLAASTDNNKKSDHRTSRRENVRTKDANYVAASAAAGVWRAVSSALLATAAAAVSVGIGTAVSADGDDNGEDEGDGTNACESL